MRKEAAASAEALAAEKAAKFAADAEATELKRFLDDANAALSKQREFAQRLGTDAKKVKKELAGALASRSDLVMNNQGLTQVSQLVITSASGCNCLASLAPHCFHCCLPTVSLQHHTCGSKQLLSHYTRYTSNGVHRR